MATTAGVAADKEAKYRQLADSHIFVPFAVESAGPGTTKQWN